MLNCQCTIEWDQDFLDDEPHSWIRYCKVHELALELYQAASEARLALGQVGLFRERLDTVIDAIEREGD